MHLHDVERLLAAHSYLLSHISGSHRQYRHVATRRLLTIACHGKGGVFTWRRLAQIRQDMERLADEQREAS